jgi:hypothetical protein
VIPNNVPGLKAITLAFATGECGSENWGGVSPTAFASANIQSLVNAGMKYIVSTGGAAGTFTCGSQSGMDTFLSRYMSSGLIGVDYDIEGGQSQTVINNLVAQAKYESGKYPNLRFSFTLATLAASDGSYGGVNSLGDMTIKAIKSSGLSNYTINLMVMDYGSAGSGLCVVSGGVCDMGQSAVQAVVNLEHSYGIPASKIELTPMIGGNDTTSETFTLGNADTISSYAASNGLAGIHYWSFDRDTPCPAGSASSTCNSYPTAGVLAFTKRFLSDLGM